MNLLEMQHIKKGFGENEVLKDISLSVAEGEVVSIIGPSGSGKSTLLRCATLLEQMDDGSLTYMGEKAAESINGKTVYAKPADLKKIQRHFGLVFQNFNLFPHYSVLKNIIDAPVSVQKRKKEEVIAEAKVLLEKNWIIAVRLRLRDRFVSYRFRDMISVRAVRRMLNAQERSV